MSALPSSLPAIHSQFNSPVSVLPCANLYPCVPPLSTDFRKQQEEEERRAEEEMAVRVEVAIRERVEAKLACDRVQQQVAAMVAAGRQKLREEVQAQVEREKLALLADARQKEEQKRREQEELERMLAENQRKVEEAQRRAAEERAREEGLRHKEREAVNAHFTLPFLDIAVMAWDGIRCILLSAYFTCNPWPLPSHPILTQRLAVMGKVEGEGELWHGHETTLAMD
ncbi:unnamed protein product [Closterium sp. Naga37s-1]|nr:unnamed protein product [Closterium sp. Naga37s-1]